MKPGDKVVCIYGGPWYDRGFVTPTLATPKLNGIYTIRDIPFFDHENVWGLYLQEIVNPPMRMVGFKEPVEMPFSTWCFTPLDTATHKTALETTTS